MAHSGETPGIPERPLKGVRVRCEKGRNIGPFVALASWRFKVFLGSGLACDRENGPVTCYCCFKPRAASLVVAVLRYTSSPLIQSSRGGVKMS
jgi:hypothetical protein